MIYTKEDIFGAIINTKNCYPNDLWQLDNQPIGNKIRATHIDYPENQEEWTISGVLELLNDVDTYKNNLWELVSINRVNNSYSLF